MIDGLTTCFRNVQKEEFLSIFLPDSFHNRNPAAFLEDAKEKKIRLMKKEFPRLSQFFPPSFDRREIWLYVRCGKDRSSIRTKNFRSSHVF